MGNSPAAIAHAKADLERQRKAYLDATMRIVAIERQIRFTETMSSAGKLIAGSTSELDALKRELAAAHRAREIASREVASARRVFNSL